MERYVRWGCILNCFMPLSLLVFLLFAVLLSLHLHTFVMFFYTCNFNDNGRPGDPYVKSTDEYIYKYTIVKVKVNVFP